ncbi:metal-dependent hydrolase [Haladaptatus cibarius]|uniref:metal-dependent hydrolase n=1 Tax=Haladaptatus cibarius TaxID=453847 RepID=UPI0006791FB1|nr:metal-dependent hydrolase [Haladaptatus cibarius]
MMPWGHAAFGYVVYSLGHRIWTRAPPAGLAVLALLFGTQLPDLVDKTLSWGLHLFPQGYSVAHSVFVAISVGLLVLAAALFKGRTAVGAAFTVGYWSHLAGDVLIRIVGRDESPFAPVLWPVVTLPPYGHEVSLFDRAFSIIGAFLYSLSTETQLMVLAIYLAPYSLVFLLWLVDGAPIVAELRQAVTGR